MHMLSPKNTVRALLASACLLMPLSNASALDARIEVGLLTCDVEAGTGLILGSSKDMTCAFVGTRS